MKFLIRLVKATVGKEIEISLEGRVDFDRNSRTFFDKFANFFNTAPVLISDLIIDLTKVEFLYPSALLFILSLREYAINHDIGFAVTVEEGSPIHEYLIYVGCSQYFEIHPWPLDKPRTIDSKVSPLYGLDAGVQVTDPGKKARRIVELLEAKQTLSIRVESKAIDSVEEILRNTQQHSSSRNYRLLGQVFPTSKRIRFAFYDDGVGIKSHITRLKYLDAHPLFRKEVSEPLFEEMRRATADVAIEVAARNYVSGTNYKENSGAGFNFLINELSKPTQGTVSILSANGYVRWESGVIVEKIGLPYAIPGTMVSWTVNFTPDTILAYKSEMGEESGHEDGA